MHRMKRRLTPLFIMAFTSMLMGCTSNGSSSSLETTSSEIRSDVSSTSETITSSSKDEIVLVTSITLNYTSYELPLRKLVSLKASVLPNNATDPSLKWTSSDTATVSVDSKGQCYGWKVGTATITATAKDGSGVSASCEITVYEVQATSVSLSEHSRDLYPGESFSLSASITPSETTDKAITWSSSDTNVAKVSELGVVEAVSPGVATITVSTKNGITDTCEVRVNSVSIKSFSLKNRSVSLHVSETYELTPVFVPENATNKNVNYTSNNNSVATVENGIVTAKSVGKATITATSVDGGYTSTCDVTVIEEGQLAKTPINKTYQDFAHNNLAGMGATPTQGKSKVLVVPVWLSDSTNYISIDKKESLRQNIQTAFFGNADDIGYESVSSYYSKASFGKYQFDGTVTDWFDCGLSTSYVGDSTSGDSRVQTLTSSAVNFVKSKLGNDLTDYDQDGDGFLDGLIMIYAAPDYYSMNNYKYENLWAYTSWNTGNKSSLANPTVNVFHWASYDFLFSEGQDAKNATGKSTYGCGDTTHCSVDAHTFIHETGHMLGLDDYYDYSGQYNPAGGFSMQDYNVGCHDPFSIMSLGWTDPYVPTETTTITIKPFQESGDMILLSPEFNDCNSPFDEYLLLEYYTPTGLNEHDSKYQYQENYPQGPTKGGIRLWHVDARLVYGSSFRNVSVDKMTSDPTTSLGKVYTAMSNTYYYTGQESISVLGKSYANYNILQLIRNDKTATYKPTDALSDDSLFHKGDTFDMSTYASQFVNSGKLNSKKDLRWTFTVNSLDENGASITVKK